MKIIYWTELFLPDVSGVGVLGQNLLPELQKRGIDFTIITSHGRFNCPDIDEFNGIPIYRFDFQSALNKKDFKNINTIIYKLDDINQKFKPDLIHLNSSEPSLFYYQHSSSRHIPNLLTIHLFIDKIHNKNGLLYRVLKNSNWVTTVSQNTLLKINQLLPEISSRSTYINNAINTPAIKPADINLYPYKFLFIGRLAEEKGADVAIKSILKIKKVYNQAKLIIAGDGPELQRLKNLSIEYNVTDSVTFLGNVTPSDVPSLINSVSLVIIPSKSTEQSSMVALESGIMERPVIASDVEGLREVVQDNITGLLFRKGNPKDLADKILYLIRNQSFAKKLGKSAKKIVSKDYNFEKCVNDYEKIYQKLIGTKYISI